MLLKKRSFWFTFLLHQCYLRENMLFCGILLILRGCLAELLFDASIFKDFLKAQNLKEAVILKDANTSQKYFDPYFQKDIFALTEEYRICFYNYENYLKNNIKDEQSCLLHPQHTRVGIYAIYHSTNHNLQKFLQVYLRENARHQKIQSWFLHTIEHNFTEQGLISEFGQLQLNTYSDVTVAVQDKR